MEKLCLVKYKKIIFAYVVLVFIVLTCFSILSLHNENDEIIYKTLATKLSQLQPYSLQQTKILPFLPQKIYNFPLFFRPPAYSAYLAILLKTLGNIGFALAPSIVFALLCIVIYKTVYLLTKSQHGSLIALLLSASSSMFLFSSVRIGPDLFLALMVSVSFMFLVKYRETDNDRFLLFAGAASAFALLINYTPVILYPVFLAFILQNKKRRLVHMLIYLLPSLLFGAWLFLILFIYAMPISSLTAMPDKYMLKNFPFINYVFHRPFYFYFANSFLVNPIYLCLFLLFKKQTLITIRKKYDLLPYFLLAVIAMVFILLTIFGLQGGTYQMRYVLMAEPFIIILISLFLENNINLFSIIILLIIHNLLLVFYNLSYGNAELMSFIELAKNYLPR
jgi:hypothetical protein